MSRLLRWFKAKDSGGNNTNGCVEGAWTDDGIKIRDSKDRFGLVLSFTMHEWTIFTAAVKGGEFDRPPGT